MLNKLHTVFIKWPVGLFMCGLLALMFFFVSRRIKHGCWVEKFGDDDWLFVPCNKVARKVLGKYCQGFRSLPMGAFVIPDNKYRDVYEAVMHDPDEPQCMTLYSPILRCNVTDTP